MRHPASPVLAMAVAALLGCAGARRAGETAEVEILPRAAWNARPPAAPMSSHVPTRITIHHTATRQRPGVPLEDKLRALQRFSQDTGTLANGRRKAAWADVPYHFYIDVSGRAAEGRELRYVGDTNTEYDPTGHALIVLEGNFEEEQPTTAQLATTARLVAQLARRWRIPPGEVNGHRHYASTLCPGRHLVERLPALRAAAATAR